MHDVYSQMVESGKLIFPAWLQLFGCRPLMLVRVAPEGGHMQQALSLFMQSCVVEIGRQGL